MDFALAVVPECPHQAAGEALLLQALTDVGVGDASVRTIMVSDIDMAQQLHFTGSPTFMVNGVDVLPSAGPSAMSCRIYRTPDSSGGLPSLVDLRQGLKRALDAAPRSR